MVRKRSRKRESSEENDSDSDLDVGTILQEPAPKKYSLRERKRSSLVSTYLNYYEEDEEEPKIESSDEDFAIEPETDTLPDKPYYMDDPSPESEGLIDFEDIIRADIVVNRNKIDYDNLIQKSEIKLSKAPEEAPKRRTRKPRYEVVDNTETICEPEFQNLTQQNGNEEETALNNIVESLQDANDGLSSDKKKAEHSLYEEIFKSDNVQSEGKAPSDLDPLEMKCDTDTRTSPSESPLSQKLPSGEDATVEEEEDDDVIVLGELKHDIIVLDD